MTYQTKNEQKHLNKRYTEQTACYDENGNYVRKKVWKGMKWISLNKRLAIYLRDNLKCQYCGKTLQEGITLSLDHVKPLGKFKGPEADTKNIVTCCTTCNFRKQDLTLTVFAGIISREINLHEANIIRSVKNALRRKVDISKAYRIIKANKSWGKTLQHLKQ